MKTGVVILVTVALLLAGCASTTSSKFIEQNNTILNKNGVPSMHYFVGSGVNVRFKAPTDGHVYLVEINSGKSILIEPLEKGIQYDFDAKGFSDLNPEESMLLKKEGVNPDNMNFAVYFVPNRDMFKKQKQSAFDENGLPKQEYYIGGGFTFNFTPQEDGMIYLVEQNSGTFVLTQTMKADESLNESIDPTNNSLNNRFEALGIDTNNMQFGLYFVPAEE